ncbi:hypothetical protein BU24DRAFT_426517 [Aaosphaeria arxii CBS 175.79]|uniref:Uncharacterized protein n=1 Tax=Aaosphaeria arxii CBS 175.79 TaxID=1450172 RepID=A0A6A5XGE1_9PLEO|nr:uncharacterized protein BU24DRAFT_426517 [Aaosphaeria arxii CBS 175.79]KAF2011434.1 hypothetical protein BU24DRAFT_426517 [Aaosphaeria arxii CBS 175.79]
MYIPCAALHSSPTPSVHLPLRSYPSHPQTSHTKLFLPSPSTHSPSSNYFIVQKQKC